MNQIINNRTVAGIHNELMDKRVVIDGWGAKIIDTTETDSGDVYFAVRVDSVEALYLEMRWIKYDSNRF